MGTNVTVDALTTLGTGSAITTLNTNFTTLADEFDKVIYKDGREELTGTLDANSQRIINVGDPVNDTDVARIKDIENHILTSLAGSIVVSTDGTFAANSDALVPTQKAVKTYVDGKVTKVTSRSALASTVNTFGLVMLHEGARSGMFRWDSSNLSAMVTLDTLQGIYVAPASDTSGASGAWVRVYSGAIDIRWFGAVSGTASGDQKPAIQCAINVAQSGEVLIPIGRWRIDSGLTYAAPVNLYGEGMAAGPGAVLNTNCSQIIANFSSGDMLKVTSLYSSIIRNIQFNTNVGTRSSGAAVHLDGDSLSSTGSNSIVDGCAFNGQYECIRKTRYVQVRIENCYFQAWATWAIVDTTTGGNEPGTGYIAHNYFRGDTNAGTTQSGCILTRAGYAWVHDNMILGGQVGVKVDVSEHDLGYPSFHDNSFEDQDVYCFCLTGSNSKTVSMLDVSNNEFSVIQTRANFVGCVQVDSGSYTIENADFEANVMRCNSGNANMRYFNFQNGNRMRVFNTTITHLSGNGLAVFVGGGSLASGEISYNSVNVVAGTMPKYSGLGVMRILDNEGVTFANLPSCANGSVLYCSDGTFANPVAGGGTGSWAKRLNSVWRGD